MTNMLGELLVREQLISAAELAHALTRQKLEGKRLGDSLVELGILDPETMARFFQPVPRVPRSIEETGLGRPFLTDLALKAAYFNAGTFTLGWMTETLRLPASLVDELIESAKAERLISIRSASGQGFGRGHMVFELTDLGRGRAGDALQISQYAGAVPVPLGEYNRITAHQSIRQIVLDESWFRNALAHLVINDAFLQQIGPAFSSGRSIFLYGPPGTGKSSVAEALGRALEGEIYVPHAVEVDGIVIRVHDPAVHRPSAESEAPSAELSIDLSQRYDPRWHRCRRPTVMVGGELTLSSLDLDYDPVSKTYEAPIHMKANNGVFILDDFGRQQIDPRQLLNRWIVPLERGTDFLSLHTGKKFDIPFDQISVFCTNLKPRDLVDEAFLRRIRHKVKVGYESEADFLEILRRVCATQGMDYSEEAARYLVQKYYRDPGRPFTGSHPRDLVEQIIDRARYRREKPVLSPAAIDAAAGNYFVEL